MEQEIRNCCMKKGNGDYQVNESQECVTEVIVKWGKSHKMRLSSESEEISQWLLEIL